MATSAGSIGRATRSRPSPSNLTRIDREQEFDRPDEMIGYIDEHMISVPGRAIRPVLCPAFRGFQSSRDYHHAYPARSRKSVTA